MNNYEIYLNHEAGNVLPVEEAIQIYNDLLKSIDSCREDDKDEFVNDFISKAIRYATIRANWELMDNETKMKEDSGRTVVHNALIDSLNILARLISMSGVDVSWREQLGDQRKRIGDFACFVVYMLGINNR